VQKLTVLEGGLELEIICFDELDSTQKYLIEKIREGELKAPVAILAKNQTAGIGSRDNSWEGGDGNLFFSFALLIEDLPRDLPLASASIYFSYIMKETLEEFKEGVFVKWPNDLYFNGNKVGGVVTKLIENVLICGIGVNLKPNRNSFKSLDLNVNPLHILKIFLRKVEQSPSWKRVFSKYAIEFEKNRDIFANIEGRKLNLKGAILESDGSLIINNRRVYSLR